MHRIVVVSLGLLALLAGGCQGGAQSSTDSGLTGSWELDQDRFQADVMERLRAALAAAPGLTAAEKAELRKQADAEIESLSVELDLEKDHAFSMRLDWLGASRSAAGIYEPSDGGIRFVATERDGRPLADPEAFVLPVRDGEILLTRGDVPYDLVLIRD